MSLVDMYMRTLQRRDLYVQLVAALDPWSGAHRAVEYLAAFQSTVNDVKGFPYGGGLGPWVPLRVWLRDLSSSEKEETLVKILGLVVEDLKYTLNNGGDLSPDMASAFEEAIKAVETA